MNPLLKDVNDAFDACLRCRKEGNHLRHILGGGLRERPLFLFLFINPTHHNISSHADYAGERRYPFLGVRYFWKIMAQAGVLSPLIVEGIYKHGWKIEHERIIEEELFRKKIYITNLVKCTQPHPENPLPHVITDDLPLLAREIEIVDPRYIVTFGKVPTRALTGNDIRLRDYLETVRTQTYKPLSSKIGKFSYATLPCYFPVGRGNPPKAIEILTFIVNNFR